MFQITLEQALQNLKNVLNASISKGVFEGETAADSVELCNVSYRTLVDSVKVFNDTIEEQKKAIDDLKHTNEELITQITSLTEKVSNE